MQQQPNALLTTGLYWRGGEALLTLARPDGHETALRMRPGTPVAWQLDGTRHCIGVWLGSDRPRVMCPDNTKLDPAAVNGQCAKCARMDPGRRIATDTGLDDQRQFSVYLAWFGPGLMKIGLTATERGTDRLTEQGALAYTWAGHGPLTSCRRAEQVTVDAGLAPDKLTHMTKADALWRATGSPDAETELSELHHHVTTARAWGPPVDTARPRVVDLRPRYGLDSTTRRPATRVVAFANRAVLRGHLACLVGRDCVIATDDDSPLLLDLRLLAGWRIRPTRQPLGEIATEPYAPRGADDHQQDSLF